MFTQVAPRSASCVGHVVDALVGDGVGVVAAAGRVGDDLTTVEPSRPVRDVGPGVAAAAAAGLGHVDVAADGAGVEEVVQVADAVGAVRVGRTEGQGQGVA